ncbi:hypothetical protein PILCRDRAFT_66638 [Piloderma croceum F 1598]|uniref:Metallo-beta-lactamase domain-containing protein n=1 Tax=Piloderma croceum (strain F 1598) TaxID=765440 RepID=A0A0C3BGM5_PILCF|nr:hypothetical protein PILCRDRAFT_66638 [Piloderma croceum F 1598]
MEPLHRSKKSIELIFLGTGTSSSVPNVDCLTAPSDREPCLTCLSTLQPEGKKNIRRNTSAVLRIGEKDGKKSTIVIDAGKNFYAAALEWFPKYGLRHIDAVLITHAHADAMNGLDDLRGWTLQGAIQSQIDIYASQATFDEVKRSFPYLVSSEYASGGGDVPSFEWHIVKEEKESFVIKGTEISVTPFSGSPALAVFCPPKEIHPYICWGFKIEESVVYLSDVSFIPDDSVLKSVSGTLPVFILDCLALDGHTSHFGLVDALDTALKVAAQRTYLTGFSHKVSHDEYVTLGEVIQRGSETIMVPPQSTDRVQKGLALIKKYFTGLSSPHQQALIDTGTKGIWLRPAHDGLRVSISAEGAVSDGTYDQI